MKIMNNKHRTDSLGRSLTRSQVEACDKIMGEVSPQTSCIFSVDYRDSALFRVCRHPP